MIKTLVLVRHAHALSRAEAQVETDALRPLSAEGQRKAAFTANRLKGLHLQPARILTSPLLRAKQTAAILAQTLACPVEETAQLNGMQEDNEVRDFLCEQLETADTLVAVGHNPNIAYVNHLLCGQIHSFVPGSFIVLHLENNKALPSFVFGE